MKLCKDCKHFVNRRFGLCQTPKLGVDPVHGTPNDKFAMLMRGDYHHIETCGPEGRWWEPKPAEPVKGFWQKFWSK